jgi:putative peptidoglycan lipid II flippase
MNLRFNIAIVITMQIVASTFTQFYIIRVIGLGADTDIYIASLAVPAVIAAVITTSLQNVWLPRLSIFSDNLTAWRSEQAIAQGQAALLGIGLFLLLSSTMSLWLPLLFPTFSPQQQQTALVYSFLLLLAGVFNTQSALLIIALRAIDRFVVSEVIVLIASLISLVILYFAIPEWGLLAVVWLALVRSILVYIVQLYFAKWPSISLNKAFYAKNIWSLLKPILATRFLVNTSPLVDRYWASQAVSGTLTLLNLAQTAMGALATILERTICMPVIPTIARQVAKANYKEARSTYRRVLLQITLIVAVIGLALILSKPLFISGASTLLNLQSDTASLLWVACVILLGYLYAGVSGQVVTPVFYAMEDTKTPSKIFFIGFMISLFIKSAAFIYFGVIGLFAAISAYYVFNFLACVVVLELNIAQKIRQKAVI